MLIESQGLRILLVYSHLIGSKVLNTILYECLSDSFTSFLGRYKEHLNFLPLDSHETYRISGLIDSYDKMFDLR